MAGPTYNTKAGQGKVTFEVDPITLRAMLKTIGKLDKDVQNEIRDNSQKLSLGLKDDLTRAAMTSPTPVARRVMEEKNRPESDTAASSKKKTATRPPASFACRRPVVRCRHASTYDLPHTPRQGPVASRRPS